jgi:hypothetical protein
LKVASAPELAVRVQSLASGATDAAGADPIDTKSVSYQLQRVGEGEILGEGALFGPEPGDRYATRLDLSRAATGDHRLTITARTRGGRHGVLVLPVRIDAGPHLLITSPAEGSHHKGRLNVQILVDPAPFGPGPVEAFIGKDPLPLAPGDAPGRFVASVVFDEFTPPLVGERSIRVRARNDQGTLAESQVKFVVDLEGPSFVATEPAPGAVVGGVIRVRAKLADGAGVLGPSVIAIIGNKADVAFTVELKPEPGQPGVWSELFDTAKLTRCRPYPNDLCLVYPSVSFRAADVLGNESATAYDFAVDNQPPLLDLDPPPVRVSKWDGHKEVCSWRFDPLGAYRGPGDAPSDLCAVPQVFDLRSLVEDQGNPASGLKGAPIATIDPTTTAVYVLADTTQPLVVDTDGDEICDAINPRLVPTTKPPARSDEVLMVRLAPVAPTGSGNFTPDPSAEPLCRPGAEPEGPKPLCPSAGVPMALGHPHALGPEASVWGLEAISANACLGSQFDTYANRIPENAWACVASTAADRAGNRGVSAPLRLWVKYRPGAGEASCPAAVPAPPPSCTGTLDAATGALTAKPCRGVKLAANVVRWMDK